MSSATEATTLSARNGTTPEVLDDHRRAGWRFTSLTIFNAMIDVTTFNPSWSMRPIRRRGLDEVWLKGMSKPLVRSLIRLQARNAVGLREIELIPAMHLPHEDQPGKMADYIARLAR